MGHFSNGTEADRYRQTFCDNCLNDENSLMDMDDGCPIWDAHFINNSSKVKSVIAILELFIPRVDGVNQECTAYLPKVDWQLVAEWEEEEPPPDPGEYPPADHDWREPIPNRGPEYDGRGTDSSDAATTDSNNPR